MARDAYFACSCGRKFRSWTPWLEWRQIGPRRRLVKVTDTAGWHAVNYPTHRITRPAVAPPF